jgi:3-isopropylmalate/(R)-2-methylmalate dehydratase small subunit
MDAFTIHRGITVALDRSNVDTDAIIPKQFLKSIKRSGFGPNLFDEWRYLDKGEPGMDNSVRPLNPDFVLNQSRFNGASVLIARKNFGCGSSREHAPWALQDYGFRAVVASSFADIFFNNCYKIGLLPIVLTEAQVQSLVDDVNAFPGFQLVIDLSKQIIGTTDGAKVYSFEIDAFRKHCLVAGLDEIGLTLKHADKIRAFEDKRLKQQPWLSKTLAEATPN